MSTHHFEQLPLVIAILQALERQQPDLELNEQQYAAVVRAADAVIAALSVESPPPDRAA